MLLPTFGILIELDGTGGGSITSELKENDRDSVEYDAAIDGLESLILGHAVAGIDIQSPAYLEGIETAVNAIGNNL